MDMNRNQFFLTGLVILFLGIQLRYVDSYVLNEPTTDIIVAGLQKIKPAKDPKEEAQQFVQASAPVPPPFRSFSPPDWLGWALISVGSVLILNALAMKKPG